MSDVAQSVFPQWKPFLGDGQEEKIVLRSIVKRNGEIEAYNRKKIEAAINKAIMSVEGENDDERTLFIFNSST